MKIIINADDCGKTRLINEHIEAAILRHKLSSTTVMANMDDFSGAISLYKKYKDIISFGCHLNLTEGEPLLKSHLLLNYGYLKKIDGRVVFNGNMFRKTRLPRFVKEEIFKELDAQILKLKSAGIQVSHLDSHHHIHTSPNLMGIIAKLSIKHRIPKIRRIKNYLPLSLSFILRQMWYYNALFLNHRYIMTDYFCSLNDFIDGKNIQTIENNSSIELMVHPGHPQYADEESNLLDFPMSGYNFINYNQL